jgi:Putative metallopeptidase
MNFGQASTRLRTVLVSLAGTSAILAGLLTGARMVAAQPAPDSFEARLSKIAAEADWPRLKGLTDQQRRDTVIFTVGNMLYGVFHEMGHAVISEMQLPVVGREEDAADSFAIVAALKLMTNVSVRALIESGKGWFLSELSDRRNGAITSFYEAHGMNLQRAYQIVCFMVGADPEKFKGLAEATNLPATRQQSCNYDYTAAAWSWGELLRPHLRKPDQAMTKIDVAYLDATADLDAYARSFKDLQFLERIANMAADKFVWGGPFSMEMKTCERANAFWAMKDRKLVVCYELIDSYVQLYIEFMNDPKIAARMKAVNPPKPMR